MQHLLVMPNGALARDYYSENGASQEILDTVFTSDGQIMPYLSWSQLNELEPEHLLEQLLEKLEPLYIMQQIQLNSVFETGFNDHGPIHIRSVAEHTLQFLKYAAVDTHTQKLGVWAACTHDLGNVITRKGHQIYSWQLLTQLVKDFEDIPEADKVILQSSIVAHDEGSLHVMVIDEVPTIAWALILADKTDVSFQRVTALSDQKSAVNDLHIVVNFMVDTSDVHVLMAKNQVQWKLDFNPQADAVKERFSHLLKNENRKWVPDTWQELYRNEQIEYVFVFFAKILTLYIDRLEMALLATFRLYEDMDEFIFTVEDTERHILISRKFSRYNFQDQIGKLRSNLAKK